RASDDLLDDVVLNHLQGRCAWELVEHLDRLRPHVLGHPLALEELLQLGERRRPLPALEDQRRAGGVPHAPPPPRWGTPGGARRARARSRGRGRPGASCTAGWRINTGSISDGTTVTPPR